MENHRPQERRQPPFFFSALLAGVVILTSGCSGIVPGSRAYRPLPQWEARFSAEARRDVFPNDVRQHPDAYTNVLVAWTGVITNIEYFTNASPRVVRFTAVHHYFDWIEDNSIQREKFFMSPRGEGDFAVQWVAQSQDDQRFVGQFALGDMLIAYGYPSVVRSNYVGLNPTQNLRSIKPQWYRTDILDYGRPGEPSKILKVAR
jgi:hypothetical protein